MISFITAELQVPLSTLFFLQLHCMMMSNFYEKSNSKVNVAGRYLNVSAQCWLIKFKRRLSRITNLSGAGATRFSLIDDYLWI